MKNRIRNQAAASARRADRRFPAYPVKDQAALPALSGSVLLALSGEGQPTVCLLRAAVLARVQGAQLHVLQTMGASRPVNALFPQRNALDAVEQLEGTQALYRSTSEWLSDCLLDQTVAQRFTIRHGDFVVQTAEHAAKIQARLIVVAAPSHDQHFGATVTALAHATGRPVLVARPSTGDETIVAATDLASSDYPVLRAAARLGRQLDARLVAVHNVQPVARVSDIHAAAGMNMGMSMGAPMLVLPFEPTHESSAERLADASRRMPVSVTSIVRNRVDSVDAILAEAQAQEADLVVIGARPKGWFGRWTARRVAQRVVNQARRSVLVLPLAALGETSAVPSALE